MKPSWWYDPGAYVWIDMGSDQYYIHHITFYWQTGQGDKMFDLYDKGGGVRAGTDGPSYSGMSLLGTYSAVGDDVTVTGDGIQARYVQISIPKNRELRVSELEIYLDCPIGSYFSDLAAGTCATCASAANTGKYCEGAEVHDCPAGRYGTSVANIGDRNCDGPCQSG